MGNVLLVGSGPLAELLAGRANITHFTGDPRDRSAVEAALIGKDTLLLLSSVPANETTETESETLDRLTRGSYVLMTAAHASGVRRVVVGSTMALFDRIPSEWRLDEHFWRPRPTTELAPLCAYLVELSVRESARAGHQHVTCVRLGQALSRAEAVEALEKALGEPLPEKEPRSWKVAHVGEAAGRQPQGDRSWRDCLAPVEPIADRDIRSVVIFGAGGPVAAALAQELAPRYRLRLTDVRPLAEAKPQSEGAPVPVPPQPPHEERICDVRDAAAVLAACEGMDAILNCTVIREDPENAFRVNTLGAYHVMRAAVAHGIRRVVHTGPQQYTLSHVNDYNWDFEVTGDAPARPGHHLYGHSKYLGQEICRIFAETRGLSIPTLLYTQFVNPARPGYAYPMIVSWADSARALRAALEVPILPSPYEEFHISVDTPHGIFRNDKAKRLLNWEPQDSVEPLWRIPNEE